MAFLTVVKQWVKDIWRVELTTRWAGGEDGTANIQAKQLAARTEYLKDFADEVLTARDGEESLLARINKSGVEPMKIMAKFGWAADSPVAASTENIDVASGGLMAMDGINLAVGDLVLLKDQDDKRENGFWQVQTGAWNRFPGYQAADHDCLTYKLIFIKCGNENGGKTFFLDKDVYTIGESDLIFAESIFSSRPAPGKVLIFDRNGRSEAVGEQLMASPDPFIIASDKRTLIVKKGTRIDLGDRTFYAEENMEIDINALLDTGTLQNGKDYYIFLCPDEGTGVMIRISLDKNSPQGFDRADVKLIAGFHTLCVDVGTGLTYIEGGETKNHPLNGYVAGDIIPLSVWCLNHRPHSEPEGMVYIPILDFWVDIYLQSGSGANTKSAYQGAITRNRQYVDIVEDMLCVKKELLDDAEFAVAMMGSNEKTAVLGASESGATSGGAGGRKDTANRRMISIFGCEEGCGSIWQFLRSTSAGGAVGSMYGPDGWLTMTTSAYGPFEQSGGKGSLWGLCAVLLAGGGWNDSSGCGSRARHASNGRSRSTSGLGGRGRSRPMRLL